MRENKIKKRKKKKLKLYPTPTHTLIYINHPHLSHPPIICNNNTPDIAFLVQMRQANKCESVRNNEIINLHLGFGAGP